MQTSYYSNYFQILEHPLHYHHEKNTSIVLMLHACVPSINVNMVFSNHDGLYRQVNHLETDFRRPESDLKTACTIGDSLFNFVADWQNAT